jgi:hypothetical protein
VFFQNYFNERVEEFEMKFIYDVSTESKKKFLKFSLFSNDFYGKPQTGEN